MTSGILRAVWAITQLICKGGGCVSPRAVPRTLQGLHTPDSLVVFVTMWLCGRSGLGAHWELGVVASQSQHG